MLYFDDTLLIDLIILILFICILRLIIKGFNNKYDFKDSKLKTIFTNKVKVNNSYVSIKNNRLRNEYIKLHGVSRMEAVGSLDRQIDALQTKHPDKTMTWYIEKAIHDLKRDRRV
ncbi:MAG TPA: hypothetical protein DD791_10865 [Syntrophomonas sp.]|jgi:hypothetical protein|nr:hypothetical protein [Syntrophomonas sp.]